MFDTKYYESFNDHSLNRICLTLERLDTSVLKLRTLQTLVIPLLGLQDRCSNKYLRLHTTPIPGNVLTSIFLTIDFYDSLYDP
eukprot:jgi/Psemu1/304028/fgenesh1_kg.132_\